MSFDPAAYLETVSIQSDTEVDAGFTAVALAALDQPGLSVERYFNHLRKTAEEVGERHRALVDKGSADDAGCRLAALKHILSDQYDYSGDSDPYNVLESSSLIRVIERRKGLPEVLALFYIHAGLAQGWDICGLNVPGRFVCRLEKDGVRLMFDPAEQCRLLEASDLRGFVKKALGTKAELSVRYFDPVSARDHLILVQNRIKSFYIEVGEYSAALRVVERMRRIAPREYRLLLDAGVLYARTKQIPAAIDVLEDYIKRAPKDRDRQDAALLLQQLKEDIQA